MDRRESNLDTWRGLAVALMVVDHACLCFPTAVGCVLRVTVDRAALPLFALCSGVAWFRYGVSYRRVASLWGVLPVTLLWSRIAGLPWPDVLVPYALVALVAPLVLRWPFAAGALGVVQATQWVLPHPNYQVGTVLALVSLGVAFAQARSLRPVPGFVSPVIRELLGLCGRWPLLLYVFHLVVIGVVRQLLVDWRGRAGAVAAFALSSAAWCLFVGFYTDRRSGDSTSHSSRFLRWPRPAAEPVAPSGAGAAAEGGLTPSH